MDPITAINNGVAALFQFLSTPAGQKIAMDLATLNEKFAANIGDLISHLHGQVAKADPASTAPVVDVTHIHA